jgi:adenylate kinase/ribonuclease R
MPVKRKAKPKTKAKKKAKVKKSAVGKAWTAAEVKRLRTGYKKKPASQLAKELKRTLASVRGKISALGLTKGVAKKKKKPKPKPKPKKKVVARKKARGKVTRKKTTRKKAATRKRRR